MTEPTIDLDAILKPYIVDLSIYPYEDKENAKAVRPDDAKKAMLQACKECLRVASEKAEIETKTYGHPDEKEWSRVVDKQSILNVEKLIKL